MPTHYWIASRKADWPTLFIIWKVQRSRMKLKHSTRFKKDLKVCQKRHYDMNLLQQVINVLAVPAALQPQNKDHSLTGSYIPHRECHIQPDWLLIYYQTDTELYLYRTGTHADLFGL